MQKQIKDIIPGTKLLLQVCCAPCSSHVITLLSKYFDITIFYSNDNIYPFEEYNKRLNEEIKFCNEIDSNIKVLSDDYNYDDLNNKGEENNGK